MLVGCGALQADPHTVRQNNRDSGGLDARVLNFGSVLLGNSAQATESIYNSTSSSITLTSATVNSHDLQIVSPSFPVTLSSGTTLSLAVRYTPSSLGRVSATILVSSDASSPYLNIPVWGQAVAPGKLVVSSASMNFGNVQVGKSQSQSETFTNSGGTSVTISQLTASTTDFAVVGLNLPITLSPNQSVTSSVVFTPQASGGRSGNLTVSAAVSLVPANSFRGSTPSAASTQSEVATIALAGTGVLSSGSATTSGQLSAAPTSFNFGSPLVGNSQSKPLVITNTGSGSVTINQATATGPGYSLSGPSLPITLTTNQTASFSVTFVAQSSAAANGNVAIASNATDSTLNVPLAATPVAPGVLTVSSNPVSFGTVTVGNSQKASLSLTNTGGSSVTVNQATVTGNGFSMSSMSMPMTLAPNQSTNVNLACAPQSAGSLSGSLTIVSTATNNNVAVPLSATAVAAGALTVSPSSLSFGSVQTGTNQSLPATLTNTGGTSVTVTQATFSGSGYSVTGLNLPLTMPAGQSVPFNVVFAPQSAGNDNFNLSISSNASNPSLTIPITGTATSPGALSAGVASLNFGQVTVGSTQTLPETLTNSGGAAITLSQVAAGAGYSVTGLSLPMTLNAGKSASFTVAFAPQSAGSSNVNLAITNNGPVPTFTIPLSGSGVTPGTLAASSVSFGSVQVGSSSTQTATLTNSGGSSVTVSQATLTGTGFAMSGLTLPLTISAGQNFTFSITFTPPSAGADSGSIALVSNASGSTPSISLSGTGTATGQFSVNPSSFSFGSIVVGASKSLPATLSATGSSVTVTSAASNSSEFVLSGPTLPLTIPAGGTASFSLTFTPQASGAASATISFVTNTSGSPVNESATGSGTAAPQHSVDLSWSPSTSSVTGYNVYRSGTSGGPYAKLTASEDLNTSYSDTSVQGGQTYYYVTTSIGTDGMESSYSNQVSAVVPTP
jgi:hypothetical protein